MSVCASPRCSVRSRWNACCFSRRCKASCRPPPSNYAAGCRFEDAYATFLAQSWPCKVRVINWGYWGSVGIVASPQVQSRTAAAGFGSIEPPEGMAALEALLAAPGTQLGFLKASRLTDIVGEPATGTLLQLPRSRDGQCDTDDLRLEIADPPAEFESTVDASNDRLLCELLWVQLQSLQWQTGSGILPLYARWLATSLKVLANAALLRAVEGQWQPCSGLDPAHHAAVWSQ